MNCGRSSSVEWKLPKLQRRVRFPSPAPPPPGYAPGGFVMPPRQARLASHALFYLPLAPLTQPCGRRVKGQNSPSTRPSRVEPVQNSPSSQPSGRHRYKTPPAHSPAGDTGTKLPQLAAQQATPVQNSPCTPKMAHFSTFYASRENFIPLPPPTGRAGRTLYRTRGRCRYKTLPARSPAGDTGTKLSLHPQNGPFQHVLRQQGELYTACATNKPSREKKVPHQHPTSPTNAPLPQFRMQFDCLNFQPYPETLQSQRHEFKI